MKVFICEVGLSEHNIFSKERYEVKAETLFKAVTEAIKRYSISHRHPPLFIECRFVRKVEEGP